MRLFKDLKQQINCDELADISRHEARGSGTTPQFGIDDARRARIT
ncbi:hypothetical protein [Burkholderia ubonensis]|nr:hypothetical protein [Burkholderia ubonensis]MDY7789288.1 hypothetical protein [Burkholderia ubonensis]